MTIRLNAVVCRVSSSNTRIAKAGLASRVVIAGLFCWNEGGNKVVSFLGFAFSSIQIGFVFNSWEVPLLRSW